MMLGLLTPLAVEAARQDEARTKLAASLGRPPRFEEIRELLDRENLAAAGRPPEPISPADHARIDALEAAMLSGAAPAVDLPLVHRWTPGLYIREIFMPAGTLLTSKIHKTEHPYVVTKGRVSVYIPGVGVEELAAGHFGITKPGTRRVLYIHEDTTWITFHPNADDEGDLAVIEQRLIEPHLLPDGSSAYARYADLLGELPEGFLP